MHGRRDRKARVIAEQSGFTIVELLLAAMIGLILMAVASTVFITAGRTQPGQVQRGNAIQLARTTMERLTREVRQGSTVYPSTATQLSLLTFVHSATCGGAAANTAIQCKVTYTCTSASCTRVEAPPPGAPGSAGAPVTVVSGLSSASVFSYTPTCSATSTSGSPGYICTTLTFPGSSGDDAITVQDGAQPLNPTA
jgi:prepilin-type N-terminal cleavage/methylation domain-containing protein